VKKTLFSSLVASSLILIAGSAFAAQTVDFSIAIDNDAVSGTNLEIDGVAVSADGNTMYFFDSDSSRDGLMKYDVVGNTVTEYVTEAQIESGLGTTSGASCDDLALDAAGNVYAIFRSPSSQSFVVRVPSAGTVEQMVTTAAGTDVGCLAVDETNNRLYLSYDIYGDDGSISTDEPISYVALNATSATPTELASETSLRAALDNEDVEISSITVQSDGSVLAVQSWGASSDTDGDIIKITSTGTVSKFAESSAWLAAAGYTDIPDARSVYIITTSNDKVVLIQAAGGSGGELLVLGAADGSSWEMIAFEADVQADADIPETFDIDVQGHAFAIDASNTIYWAGQTKVSSNSLDAVIKMTGLSAIDPLAANSWELFQ
jgi:SMP-30/Gluconolactonase/LRE-like region